MFNIESVGSLRKIPPTSGVLMLRILISFFILIGSAFAQEYEESFDQFFAALETSFDYKQGNISFLNDQAFIETGLNLNYLDATDAQRLLTEGWGNPPDDRVLGMLLPSGISPFDFEKGWGVVVTYADEGYVSDKEANKIDFDKMLKDMQRGTIEANKTREEAGYETIELVGWATSPHYDSAEHKLYWAEEIKFGDMEKNTLNYNIRVLGRKGYLNLNVIGGIDQLSEIEMQIPDILQAVSFAEGSRYEDFNSATDKLAKYGIAGLIAGGVAAKAGFFAKIGLLLLGLKKIPSGDCNCCCGVPISFISAQTSTRNLNPAGLEPYKDIKNIFLV